MLALSGLSCVQTKIPASEKRLLFTYSNIADYSVREFRDIDQCETYQKVAVLDYINQYTYTFDSSKAEGNEGILFINTVLQRHPSVLVAKQSILGQAGATRVMMNLSFKAFGKGIHLKEDNRLVTLGDQNYHSYIMNKDNRKIGNFLVIRVGRYVMQTMIIGLYFDDELLDESLSMAVESLRKKKK